MNTLIKMLMIMSQSVFGNVKYNDDSVTYNNNQVNY